MYSVNPEKFLQKLIIELFLISDSVRKEGLVRNLSVCATGRSGKSFVYVLSLELKYLPIDFPQNLTFACNSKRKRVKVLFD